MILEFNKLTILLFLGIIITLFKKACIKLEINNHVFGNSSRSQYAK